MTAIPALTAALLLAALTPAHAAPPRLPAEAVRVMRICYADEPAALAKVATLAEQFDCGPQHVKPLGDLAYRLIVSCLPSQFAQLERAVNALPGNSTCYEADSEADFE
jgi:hypothetical protein